MTDVNLDILTKEFPQHALLSRRGGGGKDLTYVATHTVIRRLNEATGNNWNWKINNMEMISDLMVCYGTLTIPGLGSRDGIGVQKISPNGGEDLVKGASSDALKKAATLFGVALELYGPDYEGEDYNPAPRRQQQRPQQGGGYQQNGPARGAPANNYPPRDQRPQSPAPRPQAQPAPSVMREVQETRKETEAAFQPSKCSKCERVITKSQAELSHRNYGFELCPKCQSETARPEPVAA